MIVIAALAVPMIYIGSQAKTETPGSRPPVPGRNTDEVTVTVPAIGHRDLTVPKSHDVAEMTAEVYGHPFGLKDTGSFPVPADHFDPVLRRFSPAEVDDHPYPEMIEIGTIRIKMTSGETQHVSVYWAFPGSELYFSLRGIRCRVSRHPISADEHELDGAMVLDDLLRKIAATSAAESSQ
jgi:hypothetical protein